MHDGASLSERLRGLVDRLCSEACEGRASGSPGGREARRIVREAFRGAGLEPHEQPIPESGGANLVAVRRGELDRWVLVGAHYDHIGRIGGLVHPGADDNAAAVAILVEAARALVASPPRGRGIVFVAFDAEEPPTFLSALMGSEHFASEPPVPLSTIDLAVVMDLFGHTIGPPDAPGAVRDLVFALGAERSAGTAAIVDALASVEPGVVVRRADAEVVPPLSDYWPFWRREVPFLFLTCGRGEEYHTPQDVPERLDFRRLAARAYWLERLIRAACERPEGRVVFLPDARDDASTLRTLAELADESSNVLPGARRVAESARALLVRCDASNALPPDLRRNLLALVQAVETGLA